jgi:divalent metal cation (Fe/Co/Zn/Cd) transporter
MYETSGMSTDLQSSGQQHVRAGIAAEWMTIAWMVIESAVSLGAGILAGSIALIAFGLDSVIELISAGILLWRLQMERRNVSDERVEHAERAASKVAGWSLLLLAVYVVLQSGYNLWTRASSAASLTGIMLAVAALVIMPVLVRVKLRVASAIDSPALRGDAASGIVCAYMAGTLLIGLVLRGAFGWWWADPAAALGIVYFIVREGVEALNAQDE